MTGGIDRSAQHPLAIWDALVAIVAFVYAFFLQMPLQGPGPSLDRVNASWEMALSYCLVHGKQFGTDVVFNFGPLGCCYPRLYYPDTYALTFCFWLLLTSVLCLAIWQTARESIRNPLLKLVWLFALITFAGLFTDSSCFAMSALLIYRYFIADSSNKPAITTLALLSVAAGLLGLSKFTFCIASLWCLFFITCGQLAKRRFPYPLVLFTVTFLTGWLALGQHLANLLPFFKNSFSIAHGYSEAMAVSDVSEYAAALPTAAISVVLTAIVFGKLFRQDRTNSFLASAAFLGLFVLIFKAGFIRNQATTEHTVIPTLCSCFIALLLLPKALSRGYKTVAAIATICSLVISTAVTVPISYNTIVGIGPVLIVATALLRSVKNATTFTQTLTGHNPQGQAFDDYMHSIVVASPLPPSKDSMDIYPSDLVRAIANHSDLNPRPIFQGYQAYSTDLLELNADALRKIDAPKLIALSVNSAIDNRLPSLDDSLSWLEILKHYSITARVPDAFILTRNDTGTQLTLVARGKAKGTLGTELALPNFGNKIIWAEIRMHKTALAPIQALVYKFLPPLITLTTASGQRVTYTAPSEMLSSGFVLSPLVLSSPDFAELYGTTFDSNKAVTSIMLQDRNQLPWPIFQQTFEVTFSEIVRR